MWSRLMAPEDGYSQLQRESLAIIESYGTTLMEVVCRDACDGHEIGRVTLLRTHTLASYQAHKVYTHRHVHLGLATRNTCTP